ncbi:MAG: phospholipase D-like domain-containing protein [Myxococcota bacterium]|nr:phospholipase D-like domain-containing protein [Myxococcota bacterium]
MKKQRRRQSIPADSAAAWAAYCVYPEALIAGNGVELLVDGAQAYPAMLKAIAGAEKTILMDSYIFHGDRAGQLFAKALSDKAEQGILVYLTVDGVGTLPVSSDFFTRLEKKGVNVLIYRSPAPWRKSFGLLRRNHRKLLVVDGRIGFAGGLNIGEEWLPKKKGGQGWHDVHLCVKGPAVRELSRLALSTWQVHGSARLAPRVFLPKVAPMGSEHVNVIGSRERKKRRAIRKSYLQAIKQARQYIYIANAYFLPDRGFWRALKNACRRGVDVRLMVPRKGDILPFQLASEALWGRAMRAGIRIFLWGDAVLHAKTAVIDDQWATVGSFNLDHRSWTMNLEVNINIVGPKLSGELREVFLKDQAQCQELTRERWRRRSWYVRVAQRFFYLFRKFM